MGGWHAVEGFISEAGKHSTWAGKFYNTFFDVFRLLFLVSIVDNTFKGEDKNLGSWIMKHYGPNCPFASLVGSARLLVNYIFTKWPVLYLTKLSVDHTRRSEMDSQSGNSQGFHKKFVHFKVNIFLSLAVLWFVKEFSTTNSRSECRPWRYLITRWRCLLQEKNFIYERRSQLWTKPPYNHCSHK